MRYGPQHLAVREPLVVGCVCRQRRRRPDGTVGAVVDARASQRLGAGRQQAGGTESLRGIRRERLSTDADNCPPMRGVDMASMSGLRQNRTPRLRVERPQQVSDLVVHVGAVRDGLGDVTLELGLKPAAQTMDRHLDRAFGRVQPPRDPA